MQIYTASFISIVHSHSYPSVSPALVQIHIAVSFYSTDFSPSTAYNREQITMARFFFLSFITLITKSNYCCCTWLMDHMRLSSAVLLLGEKYSEEEVRTRKRDRCQVFINGSAALKKKKNGSFYGLLIHNSFTVTFVSVWQPPTTG